jgi:hypothetical protein
VVVLGRSRAEAVAAWITTKGKEVAKFKKSVLLTRFKDLGSFTMLLG